MSNLVPPYVNIDANNPTDRARNWGVLSPDFGNITNNAYITNSDGSRKMFKMLYIGGAGTVAIEKLDGTIVSLPTFAAGTWLPTPGWRVMTTGTTATNIVWFGGQGGSLNKY